MMARQSSVDRLPEEVRKWLDESLVAANFSGYELLETALREHGCSISKSAIHRYGQRIERRMAAITSSVEGAKLIVQAAGDDQDALSESVIALVQSEMFEAIIALQEAGDEEMSREDRIGLLSSAAKNIATLSRASVNQKKFRMEVQARVKAAASAVEKIASKGGMSAQSKLEMYNAIMGIAG